MKKIVFIFFFLLLVTSVYSDELSADLSYKKSLYKDSDNNAIAFNLTKNIDLGSQLFNFQYYFYADDNNKDNFHQDIRELNIEGNISENWLYKIGVSRVFWGVTESIHLVDIINQTDFKSDLDGETKLGQAMINFIWQGENSAFDSYYLPYFRKREFKSPLANPLPYLNIQKKPVFESGNDEWSPSFAFRYKYYFKSIDLGISAFKGLNRDPIFKRDINNQYAAIYNDITQIGIDMQAIYGSWLLKFEGIYRDSNVINSLNMFALGFEKSFVSIYRQHDLSFLGEYIHSNENHHQLLPFNNDVYIGLRYQLNDVKSTEYFFSYLYDLDHGGASAELRASRRFFENYKVHVKCLKIDSSDKNQGGDYELVDHITVKIEHFF